jgi:hypothetical protein
MNYRLSLFLALITFILPIVSCTKSKALSSTYIGKNVTLLAPCVLCKKSDDVNGLDVFELSISDGQTITSDYQLQKGQTIHITKIEEVVTDSRGPWIAAQGYWTKHDGKKINFIYCWSSGNLLNRAPWESKSVKLKRTFADVP